MIRSAGIFIVFSFHLSGASSQITANQAMVKSLDSLLMTAIGPNEPGDVVLVAKKGEIIYEKAFGSANLELSVPLKPDMEFRIGSITKQFTAIGILQLMEQEKISLQDSVQKYVPEFPAKEHTITIENLLTHTSGIIDYSSIDDPDPFAERRDFTLPGLIKYFKKEPLQFEPGTKYSYSNSNYTLLAYIIEKVSGKSYHDYMKDNVLERAGLTHTLYADESTVVPGRVAGYRRYKGSFANCDYQSISLGYGAGDLISTAKDLYSWNQALLDGKLVKEQTLEKAFTPFQFSNGQHSMYGYGWFIDSVSIHGIKWIHHEGQVSGFMTEESYFPATGTYVAILTNVKSGGDNSSFSNDRFRLMNNILFLAIRKNY